MANNNLGIILLSGILTLSTAPFALSQSGQGTMQPSSSRSQQTGSMNGKTQANTTTQDQSNSSSETTSNKTTKKSTKGKTSKNGTSTTKGSQSQLQSKDDVQQVQTALQQKGFDPGPIDGVMGPKTQKAIAGFQRQQNLYASGTLDPKTQSALGINANQGINSEEPGREKPGDMTPAPDQQQIQPNDQERQKPDQQYQNQPVPGAVKPDIGSNSSGANMGVGTASSLEDIRQAQTALKNRGFDPGEINGMLSSETQDAIRKFQSANNLPVTGNLDDRTQSALGITVKQNNNPDTFHNEGMNNPPENNDPAAMGPSAEQQAENDPPAAHKRMGDDVDTNGKTIHEYRERAYKAGEVLDSLTAAGDNRIPDSILRRAEAIAIIPGMMKGAFVVGGRYGKGLIAERSEDGRWRAPAYIAIGGGSFGAQLGVSSTDLVLVFTDKEAVKSLETGISLKLGVDAGVSAGPIGREAEAGVSQNVKGGIYAYSRSKGLFAGIALDGAVLDMDKTANRKVYGANVDSAKIMTSSKLASNANVRPFMKALDNAVPMRRPTER